MGFVRIRGLDESQAEQVIASVWCILEARALASPRLAIANGTNNRLIVEFVFPTAGAARILRQDLKVPEGIASVESMVLGAETTA